MVACCIVERDTGRALLVRDRTGIKPLYLSSSGGRLRFASTIPALLAGGDISTDLDLVAVHHQLTLHGIVPAPRTLLRDVPKLAPGPTLAVQPDGTANDTRSWDPPYTRHIGPATGGER